MNGFFKGNFFNHFSSQRPNENSPHSSYITDFAGKQWGYDPVLNLYEQLSTGIQKNAFEFQKYNLDAIIEIGVAESDPSDSDNFRFARNPNVLVVNRLPFILFSFAANGSVTGTEEISYYLGMAGSASADFQDFTKTPAGTSAEEDFNDTTKNGILKIVKERMVDPLALDTSDDSQEARIRQFKRFLVVNPGGFINYNGASPLFPAAAGSLMENSIFRVSTAADVATTSSAFSTSDTRNNTGVNGYVPTPFTTGGRPLGSAPVGEPGDVKKAWNAANSYVRTQVSSPEIVAYIGYEVPYTDNTFTTHSTADAGLNNGWDRFRPESRFGSFRKSEWDKLQVCGFDTVGYDTGGRIYFQSQAPGEFQPDAPFDETADSTLWSDFVDNVNSKINFEAVARDSDGNQHTGASAGTYETVRSWTIFKQLVQINNEEDNTVISNSTNSAVGNYWLLNPSTTEIHMIFRWTDLLAGSSADYKKAAWTAFHRGWIPGISTLASGEVVNHKGFIDYIAKLNDLDPTVNNSGNTLNPYSLGVEHYPLVNSNRLSHRIHNFSDPTSSWTFVDTTTWKSSTTQFNLIEISQDAAGLTTGVDTCPRLRYNNSEAPLGYKFLSIDLNWGTQVNRDAFVDKYSNSDIKFRLKLTDDASLNEDVETLSLQESITLLADNPTWGALPTNGFLRLIVPSDRFTNTPTPNALGLGTDQGWDADMKCIIDIIVGANPTL